MHPNLVMQCVCKRIALAISLCIFAPILSAQPCALQENIGHIEVNEDNLLIAVMRVNNRPVAESMDLYQHNDNFLLPISQLGFLFDLDWMYNKLEKRFYSKYKSNEGLCEFDIKLNHTVTNEKAYWAEDDYDTYVDVHTIAKLLEGEASFNEELQQLNFSSSDDSIGISSTQSEHLKTYYNHTDTQFYPIVRAKYRTFTSPIVNYTLNAVKNKHTDFNHRANLNARFDLIGLASEYRFSNTRQNTHQFLKFSKNILMSTEQTTELGNLNTIEDRAIKYEVGDISLLSDELLFPSKQVLGINLFSYSQNQSRNFSNTRIEETVLPGWRAVLFRNGQFIEEQLANENNLVIFDEVPVFYGVNTFGIQLYGPEGQEEYRQQVLHVGENHKKAKQFDFRFSAGDASQSLLNGNSESRAFDQQFSALASYGLNDRLTVTTEWQELPNAQTNKRYMTSAFDYANWNSLFRLKYAKSVKSGDAIFAGVRTSLPYQFTANINYKYLDDFSSELYQAEQGLEKELQMQVNGIVEAPFKLGVNFSFKEQRYATQAMRRALNIQTNQSLIGGTFSNNLQINESRNGRTLSHSMYLSQAIDRWQLRQSLTWEPINGDGLTRYSANLRWPQTANTFNETRLNYVKTNSAKFELAHQFNWRAKYFNFQVGSTFNSNNNWSLTLGIAGSFYKNKNARGLTFTKPKGSSARRIEAIAFIDADRDGLIDEEEKLLQEIAFSGRADWKHMHTDENGQAELFTVADYQKVSLEESSLNDPFLSAQNTTQIVASHAGGVAQVYFPLTPINDVEGIIVSQDESEERGILGLTVQLRSIDGESAYETRTERDGYFFFPKVPPGKYELSVNSEQLSRLSLQPLDPVIVEAPKHGDIVQLDTIRLKPLHLESLAQSDFRTALLTSPTH